MRKLVRQRLILRSAHIVPLVRIAAKTPTGRQTVLGEERLRAGDVGRPEEVVLGLLAFERNRHELADRDRGVRRALQLIDGKVGGEGDEKNRDSTHQNPQQPFAEPMH